jgi:hypothetical protein
VLRVFSPDPPRSRSNPCIDSKHVYAFLVVLALRRMSGITFTSASSDDKEKAGAFPWPWPALRSRKNVLSPCSTIVTGENDAF